MTDLYNDIEDQKKKVKLLKDAFEAENDIEKKTNLLVVLIEAENKLDKMEDAYLHNDEVLDKIAEAVNE